MTAQIGSTCPECGRTGFVGPDFGYHVNMCTHLAEQRRQAQVLEQQLKAQVQQFEATYVGSAGGIGGIAFGSVQDTSLYRGIRSATISAAKISAKGRDTLLPGDVGGPPVDSKNSKLAAARAAHRPSTRGIERIISAIELDPYLSDVEKRLLTNRVEIRPTDVELDAAKDELRAEGLYP